jgi:CRP-like cAMP-binding protein
MNGNPAVRNRFLASLPDADLQQFLPKLQTISLSAKEILFNQGEPIRYVYFPVSAVVSLLNILEDGDSVEIATIGNEGIVSARAFFDIDSGFATGITQGPGDAMRARIEDFREYAAKESFKVLGHRYTEALLSQIVLSAGCNRFHSMGERYARWLLTMQDQAETAEFPLTQEFQADILGVRRQSVAAMARVFQKAGLIDYTRGKVKIVDRPGLESAACNCYSKMKREFERILMPETGRFHRPGLYPQPSTDLQGQ